MEVEYIVDDHIDHTDHNGADSMKIHLQRGLVIELASHLTLRSTEEERGNGYKCKGWPSI